MAQIPVIDLFAGPGGLGEGFSAYCDNRGRRPYQLALSIEKDKIAHSTLELRSFFRQFRHAGRSVPAQYYDYLAGILPREQLLAAYPKEATAAQTEALCIELGGTGGTSSPDAVDRHIRHALADSRSWVLLGGPPCQAYSGMGRSRMVGAEKKRLLNGRRKEDLSSAELAVVEKAAHQHFSEDPRHVLYREYLRIIAKHAPPVFVMENVRGILSSKKDGVRIFPRILQDLRHPYGVAHEYWPRLKFRDQRYRVCSFVTGEEPTEGSDRDFLIKAEEYGVPQARHRVILLGLREDLFPANCTAVPKLVDPRNPPARVTVRDVIGLLPRLRSGISGGKNSEERWVECLRGILHADWIDGVDGDVLAAIVDAVGKALSSPPPPGATFIGAHIKSEVLRAWYHDSRLRDLPNARSTRTHMPSDIHRYLFVSAFGLVHGRSPKLADFPSLLLPAHGNVDKDDLKNADFADRFRVQPWRRPSTTITCHIAHDGHYFIHPDPSQCRSLTVREAARLQTFPDNYLFCGKQTHQYTQVGNAVPPLLASRLAAVVHGVLEGVKL